MIGKSAFKLEAFGSAGVAEGSVIFKKSSATHFAVNNTLEDYDIQYWTSIQGSTLIANVNVMHKKVTTLSLHCIQLSGRNFEPHFKLGGVGLWP